MPAWLEALTSLGAFGISAAILAWLARKIVTHLLSKDIDKYRADLAAANAREIERLRADLRIAATEREVTFTVLQSKRADIVAEVFAKLYEVRRALRRFEPGLEVGESPSTVELLKRFNRSFNDLMHYFGPREIYFPLSIADDVHGLAQAIAAAADLQSWAYGMDWAAALNGSKRAEYFEESRQIITERVEPLMAAVKAHCRKLIGVAGEQ